MTSLSHDKSALWLLMWVCVLGTRDTASANYVILSYIRMYIFPCYIKLSGFIKLIIRIYTSKQSKKKTFKKRAGATGLDSDIRTQLLKEYGIIFTFTQNFKSTQTPITLSY